MVREQREVKTAKCMSCHCHCLVSVYIKDGQVEKIEEPAGHPDSKMLARVIRSCPRALAAAEWVHHPARLNYPLKRVGERGEGKWRQISWEEALDEIAAKLGEIRETYGPESLASSRGTGRTHDEFRKRFLNLFGTPNLVAVAGNVCQAPANEMACAILGWPTNFSRPQPATKCILLIGANPEQAWRRGWLDFLEAKNWGAKLIVIDPRRTKPAERADLWLQPRPGTDTALLMSMIQVIIEEGLYDKDFVKKWCYGFDKLAQRAKEYPPQKTAEICWVPEGGIRAAARMYATNRPGVCHSMMGIEQIGSCIEALHARFILPAITGNIDVAGGDLLGGAHQGLRSEFGIELDDKLPAEQKEKMLGSARFKLFSSAGYDMIQESVRRVWGRQLVSFRHCFAHAPTVFRAIVTGKPYPVRALIVQANNPLVAYPNTRLVHQALKSLDLSVVMDLWMTPTAELADFVLPAASWLERPQIYPLSDNASFIEAGEAALPAQLEGKYDRGRDYELWRGLGLRLGQEAYWPWRTLEEAYDYLLEPLGYKLKDFVRQKGGFDFLPPEYKKYDRMGFGTPTGKVELYSTILERMGYDPLPRHREPPESSVSTPELAEGYPLVLTTGGRHQPFYHSEFRQVDSLRGQHPDPIVQIHPQKAAELGISDGDWVWIETPRGRIKQKCQYFAGIDPRVVHAEHGWWFPELPGEEPWLHGVWESNINVVTDDDPEHCNRISGAWPLRGELCKVYKVKSY